MPPPGPVSPLPLTAVPVDCGIDPGTGKTNFSAKLQASGGRRRRISPIELSAREHGVAVLAADGATNVEIARSLFISTKTVEHHLSSAYAKLGVHSRKELQRKWRRADSARA